MKLGTYLHGSRNDHGWIRSAAATAGSHAE
jgi:hypothetical protein